MFPLAVEISGEKKMDGAKENREGVLNFCTVLMQPNSVSDAITSFLWNSALVMDRIFRQVHKDIRDDANGLQKPAGVRLVYLVFSETFCKLSSD